MPYFVPYTNRWHPRIHFDWTPNPLFSSLFTIHMPNEQRTCAPTSLQLCTFLLNQIIIQTANSIANDYQISGVDFTNARLELIRKLLLLLLLLCAPYQNDLFIVRLYGIRCTENDKTASDVNKFSFFCGAAEHIFFRHPLSFIRFFFSSIFARCHRTASVYFDHPTMEPKLQDRNALQSNFHVLLVTLRTICSLLSNFEIIVCGSQPTVIILLYNHKPGPLRI